MMNIIIYILAAIGAFSLIATIYVIYLILTAQEDENHERL